MTPAKPVLSEAEAAQRTQVREIRKYLSLRSWRLGVINSEDRTSQFRTKTQWEKARVDYNGLPLTYELA